MLRPARALLLAAAFVAGSGFFAACDEDAKGEACFDLQANNSNTGGICDLTQAEIRDLAGNRDTRIKSACFALADCPDECSVDTIIEGQLRPELEAEEPDFEIAEGIPLCREDDVAASQCCFWAVMAGVDTSP